MDYQTLHKEGGREIEEYICIIIMDKWQDRGGRERGERAQVESYGDKYLSRSS